MDRYAKFRKLGQFQEFAVRGGDWRKAIADRAAVGLFIADKRIILIVLEGSGVVALWQRPLKPHSLHPLSGRRSSDKGWCMG